MISPSVILLLLLGAIIGQVSAETANLNCQCQLPIVKGSAPRSKRRGNVLAVQDASIAQPVTIYASADDVLEVFINGKSVGATTTYYGTVTYTGTLKHGDVIAINATDLHPTGFGAVVAIYDSNNQLLSITGSSGWNAIPEKDLDTNENDWKSPSYDACHWPTTVSGSQSGQPGTSFPYESGAQYVWSNDGKGLQSVLLRFRIGGETCCVSNNNSSSNVDGVCTNCLRWSGTGYSQKDCYIGWSRSQCYAANDASTSDYTWCGEDP